MKLNRRIVMLWFSASASLSLLPTPASGQQERMCTFTECALRIENGRLLQGQQATRVGRVGVFYRDLRVLEVGPDSAQLYAGAYGRDVTRGFWLTLGGAVLLAAGPPLGPSGADRISSGAQASLAVGGAGLVIWGGLKARAAERMLARSVWFYNEAAARGDQLPQLSDIPELQPPHYGHAGAVVGSILGLAAGLGVTSRHPVSEIGQALLETGALTFAGGFFGWRLGSGIRRE